MPALKARQSVQTKVKLSNTLRSWLPILHSGLSELEEIVQPFVQSNPVVEVSSGFEDTFTDKLPKKFLFTNVSNSRTEQIEALTIQKKSLYDVLEEQLEAPLFPTPISQKIARHIVENLNENGYYDADEEDFCICHDIDLTKFEEIRQRFIYLEPTGIGAKNITESFLFQLQSLDIADNVYNLAVKLINNMDNIHIYKDQAYFQEAVRVIGGLNNPPAIDYLEDSMQIIPDIFIFFNDDDGIEVKLNDSYYPAIHIDESYRVDHPFIAQKIKEAKSLVDALQMRKATLYKIGLMIVEYQYDFFTGGDIRPLTLKILADELGHNPSTISRAIANKYIACNRGTLAMKDFFTTAICDDVSNSAIKEYLVALVKNEPRDKPLSDMKLLKLIEEKFKVTMVRRTIAKYRAQLNIAGSNERKKLYQLNV